MSSLPQYDNEPLSDDGEEGRSPLVMVMSFIDVCSHHLLSLVDSSKIGTEKPLEFGIESDGFVCIRGYFLVWRLLLKYLQYSSSEVGRELLEGECVTVSGN